jgi:hypothetical protein
MSNYGKILKAARAESGLTMESVRDHLVTTIPEFTPCLRTVNSYHTDKCPAKPEPFLLVALADLYGIDASDLLGPSFSAMQEIMARSRCDSVSPGQSTKVARAGPR